MQSAASKLPSAQTLLCSLYLSIKCYLHFSVMINIPQSGIHEWNISPWMFHPTAFIKGCCNLLFKIRFQIGMLHYSNHKVVSLSNHKYSMYKHPKEAQISIFLCMPCLFVLI